MSAKLGNYTTNQPTRFGRSRSLRPASKPRRPFVFQASSVTEEENSALLSKTSHSKTGSESALTFGHESSESAPVAAQNVVKSVKDAKDCSTSRHFPPPVKNDILPRKIGRSRTLRRTSLPRRPFVFEASNVTNELNSELLLHKTSHSNERSATTLTFGNTSEQALDPRANQNVAEDVNLTTNSVIKPAAIKLPRKVGRSRTLRRLLEPRRPFVFEASNVTNELNSELLYKTSSQSKESSQFSFENNSERIPIIDRHVIEETLPEGSGVIIIHPTYLKNENFPKRLGRARTLRRSSLPRRPFIFEASNVTSEDSELKMAASQIASRTIGVDYPGYNEYSTESDNVGQEENDFNDSSGLSQRNNNSSYKKPFNKRNSASFQVESSNNSNNSKKMRLYNDSSFNNKSKTRSHILTSSAGSNVRENNYPRAAKSSKINIDCRKKFSNYVSFENELYDNTNYLANSFAGRLNINSGSSSLPSSYALPNPRNRNFNITSDDLTIEEWNEISNKTLSQEDYNVRLWKGKNGKRTNDVYDMDVVLEDAMRLVEKIKEKDDQEFVGKVCELFFHNFQTAVTEVIDKMIESKKAEKQIQKICIKIKQLNRRRIELEEKKAKKRLLEDLHNKKTDVENSILKENVLQHLSELYKLAIRKTDN